MGAVVSSDDDGKHERDEDEHSEDELSHSDDSESEGIYFFCLWKFFTKKNRRGIFSMIHQTMTHGCNSQLACVNTPEAFRRAFLFSGPYIFLFLFFCSKYACDCGSIIWENIVCHIFKREKKRKKVIWMWSIRSEKNIIYRMKKIFI